MGIYRHFKGGEYKIINTALDSGTKKVLVVYQNLKDQKIWVRSKEEFLGLVDNKPRFEFIRAEDIDSFEELYKRALADYQNLSKQALKDKAEFVKYALSNFLADLLPIYDHLKMSLIGNEAEDPWVQGVRHVLKQFQELLKDHGVEEIKTMGEKFDHHTMEAVSGEGDVVEKEVLGGYLLHGKLIRPAKVIVKA